MPWKEPGKGSKDPWNSGDQPPDLDEVFRNVSSRLKSIFGGGGGGERKSGSGTGGSGFGGMLSIVVIALLLWVGWNSVHIIDQAERGVVLRFGKYNRTLDPGINVTLPRPIESLNTVNVGNVRSVEDRGQMLTEDENLVELDFTVQFRVLAAQDFLFEVRDPEATLQSAAESALRESVGTNSMDTVLSGAGREKIAQDTERVLQETLDLYNAGLQITEFTLRDVNVPLQVRDAFSDVNKAREDRQRFIEESRVHANSVIPEARGQAARMLQEAEGYKQATIARAEGDATRFGLVLDEYRKAPEITRKRLYLQTMEEVFYRSSKVLLDAESNGNILYLPLDKMTGLPNASGQSSMPPIVAPQSGQDSGSGSTSVRTPRREGRQ